MSAASTAGVTISSATTPTTTRKADDRPVVVDLFSGAGGLSLGFEAAGFRVAAAVELDPIHAATHRRNFPECEVIERDIQEVSGTHILNVAKLNPGTVFAVIGGPPCQGFSAIGRRNADDPRNLLILEFSRVVRELEPKYFVLENVRGLLFPANRPLIQKFVMDCSAAGYRILDDFQILDASRYGVPQQRQRAFLLGYRSDAQEPRYPAPTSTPGDRNVRDAIGDLRLLEDDEAYVSCDVAPRQPQVSDYVAELDRIFAGCSSQSGSHHLLTGCRRPIHSQTVTERFEQTLPGTKEPISRYHRLAYNGLAPTIRAGTGADRGSHMAARPIHPEFSRCITVREAARLHSYPDWFAFHSTKWHSFRQIGNSVPPLLSYAVASSLPPDA